MANDLPNIAKTLSENETIVEANPPVNNNAGDGGTTWPSLSGGLVANTAISVANSDLAHICDFSLDIQRRTELKKFLNAQANNIREAIRAVMRALGFSDGTGTYQWLIDKLQSIKRGLKYIQNNVIQPIQEFEKTVVQYIQKVQEIIAYILSLPARLLKLLTDCLKSLQQAVSNVLSDAFSATASGGSGGAGFSDVVAAAKDTAATLSSTVSQTLSAATQAAAIATVASSAGQVVNNIKKGV
jgi:hypothetical protein